MVCQAFDLVRASPNSPLGHLVPNEHLQGLDDADMEYPPPLLEEAAVGHLLGEGVLEGVDELGKQTRLVQKLGILEIREPQSESPFGKSHHGLEQSQGYFCANDCCGLEEVLLLRQQAINARRQDGLHGRWHLHDGAGVHQAVGPRLAHQGSDLHQRPHTLLQEEGIALRALAQEWDEGGQARVVSQEGTEEGVDTRWGQGVQPHLRVVRLTPPAVAVVRPVVDQQEETGRWQALDQTLQERLRLCIQPV
jgi:hypothetical protein